MIILSLNRKIAAGVLACCFVFGVQANSDSEKQNDIRGNYWGFRMDRQGDGPIKVETEQSVYNKDGTVQSKKESGHLEFDRFGRAYIKKTDEGSNNVIENQPKPVPVPETEEEQKAEVRDVFPKRLCLRHDQSSDKKVCPKCHSTTCCCLQQHSVADIKRELAEIGELVEKEVVGRSGDEVRRHEVYRFIKKRLHRVKKAVKVLLKGNEEELVGRERKGHRGWFDFMNL
jgi:hypothetical protein